MNKTYLIFKHEFLNAIKRVGFIIMTLIVPVLVLMGIGITELILSFSEPPKKVESAIGYVDENGIFNEHTKIGLTRLIAFPAKEAATQAMVNHKIKEYFLIPKDYVAFGNIQRYTLKKELITPPQTVEVIKCFLTINLLKNKIEPDKIKLIVSPLNLEVIRLNPLGGVSQEQSNMGNVIIPAAFSLLLGLALMFGASALITGLGEEKESRLIELLFSSVSIRQLLLGKILALGGAGLLQVLIWLLSAPLLLHLASSTFGGFMSRIQIPNNFLVLGIIYFILGYLLFAILSVGIGAITPNAREGSQLSLFYILTGFAPLWFASLLIPFPNSFIWVVLTLFPVTAPVQTILRLGVSDIPTWQIITSIGILAVSIVAGLYLSIKIFRVYMLMYGKRPKIKDILQSIKKA